MVLTFNLQRKRAGKPMPTQNRANLNNDSTPAFEQSVENSTGVVVKYFLVHKSSVPIFFYNLIQINVLNTVAAQTTRCIAKLTKKVAPIQNTENIQS